LANTDEKDLTHHLDLALKNAAERGLEGMVVPFGKFLEVEINVGGVFPWTRR